MSSAASRATAPPLVRLGEGLLPESAAKGVSETLDDACESVGCLRPLVLLDGRTPLLRWSTLARRLSGSSTSESKLRYDLGSSEADFPTAVFLPKNLLFATGAGPTSSSICDSGTTSLSFSLAVDDSWDVPTWAGSRESRDGPELAPPKAYECRSWVDLVSAFVILRA